MHRSPLPKPELSAPGVPERTPVAAVLATYALISSAATLGGWVFKVPRLTDWAGDGIVMFVNTSVGAIAMALALLLLAVVPRPAYRMLRLPIRILAGSAAVLGALTLFEHASGIDLGIDRLLVPEPWGVRGAASPGRMGPPACLSFLLLGTSLALAAGRRNGAARRAAAIIGLLVAIIPLISLTAYWYRADPLYSLPRYTGIARQTASILLALSIGLVAAVPEHGMAGWMRRKDEAGGILRRLLPTLILLMLITGWLRIEGERLHLYDSAFGVAIRTVTMIVLIVAALWWTARSAAAQIDSRRSAEDGLRVSEAALREAHQRVATTLESITEGFARFDHDWRFVDVNGEYERLSGLSRAQLLGRSLWEMRPGAALPLHDPDFRRAAAQQSPVSLEHFDEDRARWYAVRGYPTPDGGLAVFFTDITARKWAEEALAARAREQAALFEFTDRLHRAHGLPEVYEAAIDSILAALACDRASILLFDDSGTMRFVAWRGLSDGYRSAVEGHSPWKRGDPDPRVICVADAAAADLPADLKAVVRAEGIAALAFIPLVSDGALVGKFMVYFDQPHALTPGETDLAQAIARQLAFGLQRLGADAALRRERELLGAIIDRIPVMITLYDPDTRVLRLNPEFERTVGWTSDQAAGLSLMEQCFPDPEYRDEVTRFMQSCRPGWMDIRMRTRAGGEIETSWANIRLSDLTQVGIGIDITDRKAAEAQLQRLNSELERFAAIASHDLKEPLRGVAYLCSFIEEDQEGLSEPSRQRLARIRGLCERLHAMVEGLLEYSRSAGNVRSEACDLNLVVRAALDKLAEAVAREHAQIIVAPSLPIVAGDATLIERTFANLIANALRYNTAPVKRVEIGVRDGPEPAIYVRDNGVGIPPEQREKIFEIFRRGPDRRADGGIGLGLALVKRWMELQGGSVSLDTEPGDGSTFLLRFRPALGERPRPVGPPALIAEIPRPHAVGAGGA